MPKLYLHHDPVYDLVSQKRDLVGQLGVVPTIEVFKKNFDVFTGGQLAELDWENVFVAGGSVVASLVAGPYATQYSSAYHKSDIDIFICGLEVEQAYVMGKRKERDDG